MSIPPLEQAVPAATRTASDRMGRWGTVFKELPRAMVRRIDPVLAALTIAALGVAFYRLGAKSLGYDEMVSAGYARLDLSHLWERISTGDANMAPYYVLLHFWVRIFGYTETALRAPTVVLGALTVPVTALLGRRLISRSAGLVAGALLTVSPFLVTYDQTARSYAVVVMLVALSWYFLVGALDDPSVGRYVGYTLAITLAILAHWVAGYVLVVQLLTLLAVKRRTAVTQGWLMVGAALGASCAVVAVAAIHEGAHALYWVPDPAVRSLLELPIPLAGARVLGGLLVILGCYGLFHVLTARPRWRGGLLVAWCFGPVLLAFTFSKLVQPMFLPKYLIIVLPAFLLLAAAGLVKLPGRATRLTVLCLLLLLSGKEVYTWYTQAGSEDYRGAVRYILAHQQPGDGIICVHTGPDGLKLSPCWEMSYYENRAGRPGPVVYYDPLPSATYPPISRPGQFQAGKTPSRFWVLMRGRGPLLQSELERRITGKYRRAATPRGFPGLTVVLYRTQES